MKLEDFTMELEKLGIHLYDMPNDGLCDVAEQTHEICLAAVKYDGYELQYVKEQTPEICMAAVEQDVDASIFS